MPEPQPSGRNKPQLYQATIEGRLVTFIAIPDMGPFMDEAEAQACKAALELFTLLYNRRQLPSPPWNVEPENEPEHQAEPEAEKRTF